LVDTGGRIVWMCLPHFDGDPIFGTLLAGQGGGHLTLGPTDGATLTARRYRPDSTILESVWRIGNAQLLLTDGMVSDVAGALFPNLCVVRRLEARGHDIECAVSFDPRFGIDRRPPTARKTGQRLICADRGVALSLTSDPELGISPGWRTQFVVEPGRPFTFVLTGAHHGPLIHIAPAAAWQALLDDEVRWRKWAAGITYDGPLAPAVRRSAITLRLLTYSPSGAPVASPTTSLPEQVGGSRNWDYRYAWPRDASIGIGAFLGLGLEEQARAFLYWLLHASRLDRPRLRPVLTVHGRPVPPEREIADWPGYAGSRPVRFGNAAGDQHQLDNYGWVLDAMWLLTSAGHKLYGETWRAAIAMADLVAHRWQNPDAGIWEVRGEPAQYVHSKLMAWLTLDRALRIAETRGAHVRNRKRWAASRAAIASDVLARGFDARRNTFVRAYGRSDLDAALLVLPLLGIEPPRSPRVLGTIDAVRRELSAGGPLLYRYPPGDDRLAGGESAFLPCSFWLLQALALTGAVDEAVELFEQLVDIGGPLGLFAEEADPATRRQLGNYPQALTHAALIQAALAIRDATPG
jgi:GH15 family glucan-1,4-alpha-glucosidase